MSEYRVRVERNKLKFAAAHMATFEGQCEPLHGHNYAVTIEVAGTLTEDSWVIDFAALKSSVKAEHIKVFEFSPSMTAEDAKRGITHIKNIWS